MGRMVLFYSFILFVAITSTLCEEKRVNSTHQEFSCGHQLVIGIYDVSRVDEAYCGKDTSTCSWTETTTFPESCSIDSLPQLIYTCNGNNNCSGAYSILNVNMCCNGATGEPTCRNSSSFNIYYYCYTALEILDLDTDKEKSARNWLIVRAPKKSDNLCECSVRTIPSHSFRYYYCDTSMHSRNCTSRQYSSKQRNFSFYPNKLSSLLLDTTYLDDTLKVNCSCSSDDKRTTSTLNPLTTSNVEPPITEKEKEKTGITEKEKEKTGITEKEKEKTGITEKEKEKTGITGKEKEKTDGSNVVLIVSVVGNMLQIIVTTVLVVCLCMKRRSSVDYSSATVTSLTDNKQYSILRKNDVLYDECDNSNVPEETATYHYIVT